MCFTNDGKYFVDGKEIHIDYTDDVPIDVLKQLEKCSMNQLDAFYIRKRLFQIGQSVQNFVSYSESQNERFVFETSQELEERIKKETNYLVQHTTDVINEVVDKKFGEIEGMFTELKKIQAEAAILLAENVSKNEAHFKIVHERIEYTINKTIFGFIRNQYELRPGRTLLVIIGVSVMAFLLMAQLFHIPIGVEIWNIIKKIIGAK